MIDPLPATDVEENQPKVYSVSELTRTIRGLLETEFDTIWVEGEISNLRVAASKHAYFVLKDKKSQVRCVLFKGYRAGLKYQPEEGDHVHLFGRVTVYDARGEYQIVVETLEPAGLGALQKAFEQLKKKLAAEGLFDEERKKTIPEFPWKVGVITSPTGAAVRDILNVIGRRNPKISVLINPVKVQGEGSAEEIAGAINEMNRVKDVDVLIVGRGGGSVEDLWAFNEEIVARAIAASEIPVVSAVGHEIDFTIADFAADLRAPTPSAAAELTVPVLDDVLGQLVYLTRQLVVLTKRLIEDAQARLRGLADRRFFRDPMRILASVAQRLDDLNLRLVRGLGRAVVLKSQRLSGRIKRVFLATPLRRIQRLEEKRVSLDHRLIEKARSLVRLEENRFNGMVKNLHAISPLAVLDRGYSITTLKGNALKSSEDVKPGDSVTVRLSRGRLDCTVDKAVSGKNVEE